MAGWFNGSKLDSWPLFFVVLSFIRLVWASLDDKRDSGRRGDHFSSVSTFQTSASSHSLGVLLAKSHHMVQARFNGWKEGI